MLNQIIIVGRITSDPQINEVENKKQCNITLAVPRLFKNEEGIYETDFIPCVLWNGVAENIIEYCKKGDIVGVKGRIQSRKENDTNIIEIIAEKVTFLSSSKQNQEEEN